MLRHLPALLTLLCLHAAALVSRAWAAQLSAETEDARLRSSFLDRCAEYQRQHKDLFPVLKNCDTLWEMFRSEALKGDGCYQDEAAFEKLALMADHEMPEKVIFWSGVYSVIGKLRLLTDFFSLEKSLIGFTLDSLTWCSKQTCRLLPRSDSPSTLMPVNCKNFTRPFWIAASKWFASKAFGHTGVILNGTREQPFQEKTSIFGMYELPRISPSRVTSFTIYMLDSLQVRRPSGSCNKESVLRLKEVLRQKGIRHNCVENPEFLVRLQCADQPEAAKCTDIA